jgi:uncharacterized damage-inducible protein DinB
MYRRVSDFLSDWKDESQSTKNVLEALTDDSLSQRVSPNGRALGKLGWHIAQSLHMITEAGLEGLDAPLEHEPVPTNAKAILKAYTKGADSLARVVEKGWTDAQLGDEVPMYGESWARGKVLSVIVRHEAHHRGQMTVSCGRPVSSSRPLRARSRTMGAYGMEPRTEIQTARANCRLPKLKRKSVVGSPFQLKSAIGNLFFRAQSARSPQRRSIPPHHHARLVAPVAHVGKRIRVEQHQVGALPGRHRTELRFLIHILRHVPGAGLEDLVGRKARWPSPQFAQDREAGDVPELRRVGAEEEGHPALVERLHDRPAGSLYFFALSGVTPSSWRVSRWWSSTAPPWRPAVFHLGHGHQLSTLDPQHRFEQALRRHDPGASALRRRNESRQFREISLAHEVEAEELRPPRGREASR